jgi:oligoribonuclease
LIVWTDIETTGLDPTTDVIAEVALVVTDDDLNELDSMNVVVKIDVDYWRPLVVPFVRDMHDRSGLWGDCRHSDLRPSDAEAACLEFMAKWSSPDKYPMGGSSVHFDRSFFAVQMPTLCSAWSYRNIDISTVKELAMRWRPRVYDARPSEFPKAHRAIDDVHATLREARHYREFLFLT